MRWLNVMAGLRLLVLGALLATAVAAQAADYEIVARSGDVEFRRYPAQAIIQARIGGAGDFEQSGNYGFRLLAGYIRGDNDTGTDLPVNAPVMQSSTHLQFVLDVRQRGDTLPRPSSQSIELRQLPQRVVAALRYRGDWSEMRFQQHAERLLESLALDGVSVLGEPRFARYNPPFIPGFARRNEVLVTVSALPTGSAAARVASRGH